MGADPTESARLPWERVTRHLKGRTERDLQAPASERFVVRCLRPGGVLPAALVRCALDPASAPPTVKHRELRRLAGR